MYDFNQDNFISKEDVRIVLSYIPFEKYASADLSPVNKKKRLSLNSQKD
jgi:hypothetical protein